MPGFAAELRRIDEEIAAIGEEPGDAAEATRYAYLLYQRASIANDLPALRRVEPVIDGAIDMLVHPDDLYLLKANIAFKLHRLADVEAALDAAPSVGESAEGRLLRADLDFQHGRYGRALDLYQNVVEADRSWAALARLAYYHGKTGEPERADALYREAHDELTAKEMRAFAWIEVQRGFLDFARGRYDDADRHYRRAEAAYPGYWITAEHKAELLGAEGHYAEAIAILERLAAAVVRPDLEQAAGELCALAGEAERARQWHARALAGYLKSAGGGEVHYWHHLADYFTEIAEDGPAAVEWARKDLALRENWATQAALARAFHVAGRGDEARLWIDRTLASGIVEAGLCRDAAMIYAACGHTAEAAQYSERARRLNPRYDQFHIHH